MKRLTRIKNDVDNGNIPSTLIRLVEKYGVKKQRPDIDFSVRELSVAFGVKDKAMRVIMDELCEKGEWGKIERAKLKNGHIGLVYFEMRK